MGDFSSSLKKYILRPGYDAVYSVSPRTASKVYDFINCGFGFWRKKARRENAPSILMDVSASLKAKSVTGIPRAVKSVAREVVEKHPGRIDFFTMGHGFMIASGYDEGVFMDRKDGVFRPFPGDVLLLMDSSWRHVFSARNIAREVRRAGGKVFGVVYDTIPADFPKCFDSARFIKEFSLWHEMLIAECDALACISKTTVRGLSDFYERGGFTRRVPVYLFPMGAPERLDDASPPREVLSGFLAEKKTFLMVGTVEPRKGYATALDAFIRLWSEGIDVGLLIIGKKGAYSASIRERISSLLGSEAPLLWISDADDGELSFAYENSAALIASSYIEGFGLPLVEAARYSLPIIANDIPIFQEVAGVNADFFAENDADSLARTIARWLKSDVHPDSGKIPIHTWEESAEELLAIIDGRREPFTVFGEQN